MYKHRKNTVYLVKSQYFKIDFYSMKFISEKMTIEKFELGLGPE